MQNFHGLPLCQNNVNALNSILFFDLQHGMLSAYIHIFVSVIPFLLFYLLLVTNIRYRAIQKSFYQVGHDSGNECRWAAAYLANI
jgi:hypothetical protein